MILHSFHVRNFRRLRDTHITLEQDRTIFVGANNSGKTSAAHVLSLFLREDKFLMYDFNAEAWNLFDQAEGWEDEASGAALPSISLDLWFKIEEEDLYRVLDLVPKLEWRVGPVGVRIELAVKSPRQLLANYREAKAKSAPPDNIPLENREGYKPWPSSITDYLTKSFDKEFEFRYFVLDRARFNADFAPDAGYEPNELGDGRRGGAKIVQSLIRVSFMKAQRHMSGEGSSDRAEDLSRRLGRFYESHLKQHEANYAALQALANSESQMNVHFQSVFKPTLDALSHLNYPGITEAEISIRAAINARELLKGETNVHYSLKGDTPAEELLLPDKYNGLGYKNLIYMVIELLDFHNRWVSDGENRALLHLIVIEEPEAHLHAQLQQVFIREIQKLVPDHSAQNFNRQFIVTTHSPHILYAAGFGPVRYFHRTGGPGRAQHSKVLNLSKYYETVGKVRGDFLQRYMKLTHCDLFFADAAILVEGTVERLLLPAMMRKAADGLESCYISILEVGGAFGHTFKSLVDFLGLTTLVITDLDSVRPPRPARPAGLPANVPAEEEEPNESLGGDEDPPDLATGIEAVAGSGAEPQPPGRKTKVPGPGSTCLVGFPGAVTSNQTLKQWLPMKDLVADLLTASEVNKIQLKTDSSALVRVAYQVPREITWEGTTDRLAGRTLEEDFALQNLAWCQHSDRQPLQLRIKRAETMTLADLALAIHKRVASNGFDKTDFALAVISEEEEGWTVPLYIQEGLLWLANQCVRPAPLPALPSTTVPAAS